MPPLDLGHLEMVSSMRQYCLLIFIYLIRRAVRCVKRGAHLGRDGGGGAVRADGPALEQRPPHARVLLHLVVTGHLQLARRRPRKTVGAAGLLQKLLRLGTPG